MIQDKVLGIAELRHEVGDLKKRGKKIVFTNGCFDILHYGHVRYLEIAKNQGDILIVAVNSDRSVRVLKGEGRPINGEVQRAGVIAALQSADYVTVFDEDTPLAVIKELLPDVLVKGGDWAEDKIVGGDIVKKNGGRVAVIPFVEGFSTTCTVDRIQRAVRKG